MRKPMPEGLLAVALFFTACKQDESATIRGSASAAPGALASNATVSLQSSSTGRLVSGPTDPSGGQPQPRLETVKLWVGTNEVTAEIAGTERQIAIGLMRRTHMPEMEGMLFVFPVPAARAFYMRNTLLPLSCAYIDREGTILEIYDMKPLEEKPIQSRSDQVQYVLEMNQGWFERHGVKPGVAISTELGTLAQTFRRR